MNIRTLVIICILAGLAKFSHVNVNAADITVIVDGQQVNFTDVVPIINNDRTMVPLRGVFEAMGYTIEWNSHDSIASISNSSNIITVRIGEPYIIVNGQIVVGDVSPLIYNDRLMLPLRLVAESTGADVYWHEATGSVSIITNAVHNETSNAIEITAFWGYSDVLNREGILHINIINNTDYSILVDPFFAIEYFDEAIWVNVPHSESIVFPLVLLEVGPNNFRAFMYELDTTHYLPGSGLYRAIKRYFIASGERAEYSNEDEFVELMVEFYLE